MSEVRTELMDLPEMQKWINAVLEFHLAQIQECVDKLHTASIEKIDSPMGYLLRGQAEQSIELIDKMSFTRPTGESVFTSLGSPGEAKTLLATARKQAERIRNSVQKIVDR